MNTVKYIFPKNEYSLAALHILAMIEQQIPVEEENFSVCI